MKTPARMTRLTLRSSPSSTRSARWPTAIRPRSVMPRRPSGLRLAAATAAGSGMPATTTFRTAASSAMTDPASVVGPDHRASPAVDVDGQRTDPAAAIARACQRHGVAHEQQPVSRLQSRDELPECRVDVDPVGDQLDVRRHPQECRDRQPGRSMLEAAHRVEEMGRRGGAGRERGACLVDECRRMPERHGDAGPTEHPDQVVRTGEFGRDRDQPQPLDQGSIVAGGMSAGVRSWVSVVGAASRVRQERALEVEPERLRAIGRGIRHPARDRSAKAFRSSSGAVTAVGRNEVTPRRRQALAPSRRALPVAHRVVAAPAVDVDVDEARRDVRARRPRRRRRRRASTAAISPSRCAGGRQRYGRRGPAGPASVCVVTRGGAGVVGQLDVELDVEPVPIGQVARLGRLDATAVSVRDDPPLDEQRIAGPMPQQARVLGRRGGRRDRAGPATQHEPGLRRASRAATRARGLRPSPRRPSRRRARSISRAIGSSSARRRRRRCTTDWPWPGCRGSRPQRPSRADDPGQHARGRDASGPAHLLR